MNANLHAIQDRWGDSLQGGFVVLPVALVKRQAKLGLDNGEMVVLLNLLSQWHNNNAPVWAAISSFAQNMGASSRTVQRSISSLEEKGLIEVEKLPEGKVVHLRALAERLQRRTQ